MADGGGVGLGYQVQQTTVLKDPQLGETPSEAGSPTVSGLTSPTAPQSAGEPKTSLHRGWKSRKKDKKSRSSRTTRTTVQGAERRADDLRQTVREKLQKLSKENPDLLNLTDEAEMERMVLVLSDREKMKKKYFGDLLEEMDEAVVVIEEERSDYRSGGFRNDKTKRKAVGRMAKEFDEIHKNEVHLVFFKLSRQIWEDLGRLLNRFKRKFELGPFHAALVFGGIVFEWDDSELVIPRHIQEKEDWIFKASVHHHVAGGGDCLARLPVRGTQREMDEHFETVSEAITVMKMLKEGIVDALVDQAVFYNTKQSYGTFSNSCQRFVKDCFSALCISQWDEMLDANIQEHADMLIDGKVQCVECNTHQDLDEKAEELLERTGKTLETDEKVATITEMELRICHYLYFHSVSRAKPKKVAYHCNEETCKLPNLERKLEELHKIDF